MNFASPLVGKLKCHVTKTAYADNTHASSGRNLVQKQRSEDGDATTKKRACLCEIERIGQRPSPGPLNTETVSKRAVTADDRALTMGAEMVIAGKAFVTGKATVCRPANADTLANFEAFGVMPHGHNGPHRFVTGNEWVLGQTLLVVEHRKIGVTNATVSHFDFNFFWAQLAEIEFEGLK